MHKTVRRLLAFLLVFSLVATNFGGNFVNTRAYAVEDEDDLEEREESFENESIFESLAENQEESENDDTDNDTLEDGNIFESNGEENGSEEGLVDEATAGAETTGEIVSKENNEG